jgi:hypothetical protein
MPKIVLDMPDDALGGRSPEEYGRDLRLAAGMFWLVRGDTEEMAAQRAGLDLAQFRLALYEEGLGPKPQDAGDSKV